MKKELKIILIGMEIFILVVLILIAIGYQQKWIIATGDGPRFDWYEVQQDISSIGKLEPDNDEPEKPENSEQAKPEEPEPSTTIATRPSEPEPEPEPETTDPLETWDPETPLPSDDWETDEF